MNTPTQAETDAETLQRLQHDLTDAEDVIGELRALLQTRDSYEDARRAEAWHIVADLFDEAHRALQHPGTITLCSADLCRRIAHHLDEQDA